MCVLFIKDIFLVSIIVGKNRDNIENSLLNIDSFVKVIIV
jgi:hypothetical protein